MIIESFDSNCCLGSSEVFAQPKNEVHLPPIRAHFQTLLTNKIEEEHIPNTQDLINQYCLCGIEGLQLTNYMNNDMNFYQYYGGELVNGTAYDINNDQSNLDLYYANKEEMYLKMLIGYKYETVNYYDVTKEKEIVEYKCGYEDCGKILQKPWNLLDHVRMHEGVKPYLCQWCGKGFTQKGNLKKKHARQHINPDVNDRKRYSCRFCGKGYTERYNLKVNSPHLYFKYISL